MYGGMSESGEIEQHGSEHQQIIAANQSDVTVRPEGAHGEPGGRMQLLAAHLRTALHIRRKDTTFGGV